jgi:hypothetical protein
MASLDLQQGSRPDRWAIWTLDVTKVPGVTEHPPMRTHASAAQDA